MIIYVIMRSTGEYSERNVVALYAVADECDAEAAVVRLDEQRRAAIAPFEYSYTKDAEHFYWNDNPLAHGMKSITYRILERLRHKAATQLKDADYTELDATYYYVPVDFMRERQQ